MAKAEGQKLKLLYIIDILKQNTDENHPITTADLIEKLAVYGVSAERKSIYDDINKLIDFGYDIERISTRNGGGYYLVEREFELPELKLLVDAVQSSRFITQKKSRELIKKLEALVSKHDAVKLQRQVYVAGRVKTDNESIYYNVDNIHRAIQENRQITFYYYDWNIKKELVKREDVPRKVSPWALIWKDENYYLAAFDSKSQIMKHFRVDKIGKVLVSDEPRDGLEEYEKVDLAVYSNKNLGMFSGDEEMVVLETNSKLVGVIIDKFGKDVDIRPISEDKIRVRIKVLVSGQLYGWLCGIGKDMKIVSPENVKKSYIEWLENIIKTNE